MQLVQSPMVDATADKEGLTISTAGTTRWRVHAKGLIPAKITAADWDLPGLRVSVTADSKSFSVEKTDDGIDLVYSGITGMRLNIKTVP